MTGSSSIVDWNGLSLNEGIRLVATALRQHLGVRLFVVTPEGECVDISPPECAASNIFDQFVDTEARWGAGDERASMVATRRRWGEVLEEWVEETSEKTVVETAPGFSAHITPIVCDDAVRGGLVVAGFVPTERATAAVESIREVVPQHLQEAMDAGDDDAPRIVQIPPEDRRWVRRLGSVIAAAFVDQLQDQQDSDVDASTRRFCGMLGATDSMKELFRQIERVAGTNSTVLITGENGTGKELVARAIHRLSDRREQPFVAVNCAAISGELITSELFGHVEGAFSGAHQDRQGLFEAADGGTLLLDEIGDMEKSLQTKLLRVLQEGTLVRVGDTEVRSVDVRVLCATNTDLEELVRRGTFRRDLYFRIRVMKLSVPPLRERRPDIELLAQHFLDHGARRQGRERQTLSDECLRQLVRYDWPGNVRELENEIERLVIMSGGAETIDATWLSPKLKDAEPPEPTMEFEDCELPEAIEMVERKMILAGLQRTGWNKSQTARDLGVSRRNLIRKVARYELEDHRDDN